MVQKVLPGSPAALDGRLQVGDRILCVGEISLEHKTAEQVMKLLLDFPMQIRLTVFRPASETTNGGGKETCAVPMHCTCINLSLFFSLSHFLSHSVSLSFLTP